MRCGCEQSRTWLPGPNGHQGSAVTVHCKACSLWPFDRLADSLMELGGWDAAPHPQQCAWLLACLAPCSPAMSCQMSAGRASRTSARMTSLSLASSLQAVHSQGSHKCACGHRMKGFPKMAFPWQAGQTQQVSALRSAGVLAGWTEPGKAQYREVVASVVLYHLASQLGISAVCKVGVNQGRCPEPLPT